MITEIKTTVAGIVLAIAVAIVGFITWNATSNSYQNKIAQIEKKHADVVAQYERDLSAISKKAQEDTQAAITRMKAAQDALAELDIQKTQELANAQAENDNLRRDVADGTRRVRVLQASVTRCDTSTGSTGGNTAASGVGDGTAVELSPAAAATFFDLREGIARDQAKLTYLQGYVRDVVKQCKRL